MSLLSACWERVQMEIKIVGLYKQFTQMSTTLWVLKGVDATLIRGKSYAITGVSGSGKSTLLHIIAGLDVPTRGKVFINDRSLEVMSTAERTQFLMHHVGLVFQQPYLIRELSVVENVMLKGLIGGESSAASKEKAYALLARVGLSAKAESKPASLSGGQQQRVAVVRALFNQPAFLLADEPTGNLDASTGQGIIDFLFDCQAEWGMAIVVSSHDARVVERMDTVLHLHDGLLIKLPYKEQSIGNQTVLY